jgi:hypothetical protein
MNPAPDADLHSVGKESFDWIVEEVSDLAVRKAKSASQLSSFHWGAFLGAAGTAAAQKAPAKKKSVTKKKAVKTAKG